MGLTYVNPEVILLKSHAEFNERWLQDRIADDPARLGLGDLILKDRERIHPKAGRLDLLLQDAETNRRYEVEIQLGATDESHIIRTIEYWDIEQARYTQYDHVAVLVAEDITSRFLNVIALFNMAIPIIAIQISALQVGEHLTVSATTVLDLMRRGTDEDDEPSQPADRAYWESRGSSASLVILDAVQSLVQEATSDSGLVLKYNKAY